MRELTKDDVLIRVICLPEDAPIAGNALASGNDALDREAERQILDELDKGNFWAWCCVAVEAVWSDGDFHFCGRDILGCCSYENEADFRKGGYFEDMISVALDDLNAKVENSIRVTDKVLALLMGQPR